MLKTLKEKMASIEATRRAEIEAEARELQQNKTLLVLSEQAWDKFVAELNAPAKPTQALINLLSREHIGR